MEPKLNGVQKISSHDLIQFYQKILEDSKAENVTTISLLGKFEEADFMMIASGNSVRHVSSISNRLIEQSKREFKLRGRTEGIENSDWVLLDFGDVIVHIFGKEVREFYSLEKIWDDTGINSLRTEISKK